MAVVAAALSEITLSLSCTLVLSESKLAIMLVLEMNRKKSLIGLWRARVYLFQVCLFRGSWCHVWEGECWG